MSVRSKTILVRKGEGVDELSSFLYEKIGLDAYLIKGIASTPINDTTTQLTILYQEYPDQIVDNYSPRPGAIIPTSTVSSLFDTRILFNTPIDFGSIRSGSFVVDGQELDSSYVSPDYNSNNYFVKLNLTGHGGSGFHEFRIDSNKLTKFNGSSFDYSAVAGYTVHSFGSSHLGDKLDPYPSRRRGLVRAEVVRSSKGISPQQTIEEYLSQRGLDKEQLLTYTFVSRNDNIVEIYFLYISQLEPQIVEGYPLTNTLIPFGSNISNVTFVFSTKLDTAQLTTVDGLFTIESDYNTSTDVLASDIIVLSDQKTVRIDISGYCYQDRIYSIVARPGIKSLAGIVKQKPEQWVLHVSTYNVATVNVDATGTGGAPTNAEYLLLSSNSELTNAYVLSGRSGITITPGPGHNLYVHLSGNLYPDIVNNLSNFTGHTGTTGIHFTQSQIAIPSTQITDFSGAVVAITSALSGVSSELFTGHTGRLDNPHAVTANQVGAPTLSQFTGHTGRLDNPHDVTVSQIGAVASSTFIAHTGDTTIHFLVGNIDHRDLLASSIGNYAHSSIDSHIDDTSNPHAVTAAQVGSPTTGNFSFLSGQFTGHTGRLDNPHQVTTTQIGAATLAQYTGLSGLITGHTGITGIHFTQSQIAIPSTQITDWSEAVQDTVGTFFTFGSGVSGNYNDAGNTYAISGVYATTTRHGVAQFNSADFTVSNGNVSWTRTLSSIDISDFVLDTAVSGNSLMFDGTNWIPSTAGAGDLLSTNNLSDVSNKDTARKNLMVRYYIDDISPLNGSSWSSSSTAGGGSYQYDPQYASFLQSYDCQGVSISSNGNTTGTNEGSLLYHANAGLWPASGICYYFRIAVSNTGQAWYRFGLTNSNHLSTGDVTNGAYFEYNSNTNAFWLACCASGSNRVRATTTSSANSSVSVFKWFGIEYAVTGYRFYDFASGNNPIYTITDPTVMPGIANRTMRAFTQCVGNGATFRGIWLDKFAYPLYTASLPSGIA